VLSLTHVSVYKRKNENGPQVVIASKQIYANHYFQASLALTWVVDAEAGEGKRGSYLIYFNRSRIDALRGGLNWLKRYVARGRIRNDLVKYIRLIKEKLEGMAIQPPGYKVEAYPKSNALEAAFNLYQEGK
jgi:hypothetical protein